MLLQFGVHQVHESHSNTTSRSCLNTQYFVMILNITENQWNEFRSTYVVRLEIVDSNVNLQPHLTGKFYLWLRKLPTHGSLWSFLYISVSFNGPQLCPALIHLENIFYPKGYFFLILIFYCTHRHFLPTAIITRCLILTYI